MSKTMQDKETKKRFESFVTEECGDSLWGNDGTDNYDTAYDVKDKVWGFISKLEQEAERRGWKDCENFYGDMREILRPYHREGEDYRTTLKRLSKLTTK